MSLARIVFLKKKLEKKYGAIGKVAGRYVEAGYTVNIGFQTAKGSIDIVAKKEGQILAIDVITESVKVGTDVIEKLKEKAASINAKPVLVLYGSGPQLQKEALKRAEELGVEIRRVRS
ncbi:MAG TPA: hypothetical protein EYH08_02005 [Pyrodictium sp.]|nr:hypothetical protein [Pyrodictium sp.]